MFSNIGWTEILIVLALVLIFFGGTKLPKIARNMGESSKELKKAKDELVKAATEKEPKKQVGD